jgi:hypothetical protein
MGKLHGEHAARENGMLFRRGPALVPLARNVGYAFHVMEWLPGQPVYFFTVRGIVAQ